MAKTARPSTGPGSPAGATAPSPGHASSSGETDGASDRYILAIDSGTTSVRSILFDRNGRPVAQASQPFAQQYPQPGWVEHDAREILAKQVSTMSEVQFASGIHSDRIAALGITNQRETTVVWDRRTGEPVYNAICWQCRRTEGYIDQLRKRGLSEFIAEKTGLVLDPYFSASKIAWILDNVAGARARAEAGDLLFGTVDTWLLWNLTGGEVHATDRTNASRTMLYNIHTLAWDDELLGLFGIPSAMLPEVMPSQAHYGRVAREIMSARPPITSLVGDQQASLFGHGCFNPGDVKATYGTGCFILMNTGAKPVKSAHGLVTTLAATDARHSEYALEGSVFNAGSVVQWLRDELGLIDRADETERLALSVPDTAGVHMVPAFTGLGAPWWDASARGTITGITRGCTKAHIVRAALEGIAYQVYDVVDAMEADAGRPINKVSADGGGSQNRFTMQWQANMLGCPIELSPIPETTALGAAYLAGLEVGFWDDRTGLPCYGDTTVGEGGSREVSVRETRRFVPDMNERTRVEAIRSWRDALQVCKNAAS